METEVLILTVLGLIAVLMFVNLLLTLFKRKSRVDLSDFENSRIFDDLKNALAVSLSSDLKEQSVFVRDEIGREIFGMDRRMRDDLAANREELGTALKQNRAELTDLFIAFGESQDRQFLSFELRQSELNKNVEERLDKIRDVTEQKIGQLQESNIKKLDEMKNVVDEKLQESVEKRFNESFKGISDRLDDVFKGLGEMQNLAAGVGDLKRVLTNVKTRGTFGEIQLGTLLDQFLSPEQYEKNAATKPKTTERVEYAVRLPGKDKSNVGADECVGNGSVLLAIDSKFPVEDYQRLLDAYDNCPEEIEFYAKQVENAVRKNAKDIRDKYINPPYTTDFAIMFIPTEGLYAEILRRPGLFESIQRDYQVAVAGPTTLVAFLNSLQMGFKTLAVEKRTGEVWKLLGAVKTEFTKFGVLLEKTRTKLDEAARVLDDADSKTRNITRKLQKIQELPPEETRILLKEPADFEEIDL
ncbi:DNA recombination protein RmuC [Methanolapillus millepedarum]|uniref:DNA recombination protein RmuC n=1 Tax=Methanolapillus millepedarum TaxID=3028296 RepID=A0AA96V4R3_9EURY|nr:hypothetical protein MsAc7_05100 [Methanosarcinaceae archaeon Ac7]